MFGSTSYRSQFSDTLRWTACTYHEYRLPKSPPPPVKPNAPFAPPALNMLYGPLTGPPSPYGTRLSSGSGSGFFLLVMLGGLGLIFEFLSGIARASGSCS